MVAINIREFSHHLSKYLKTTKAGGRILIMERNLPIAELIPHNPHVIQPGWKRKIERVKLKGGPASATVIKMREEENF